MKHLPGIFIGFLLACIAVKAETGQVIATVIGVFVCAIAASMIYQRSSQELIRACALGRSFANAAGDIETVPPEEPPKPPPADNRHVCVTMDCKGIATTEGEQLCDECLGGLE